MQLAAGQLRNTIGLSVATFRHWKRVLPPWMAKGQSEAGNRGILILCPLDPIMAELRDVLPCSRSSNGQSDLLFPPTEINSGAQARRRRE